MSTWLQIAAIITALISPLLAVLLQERLRRAAATPDANQPKNLSQSKGARFMRHLKAYWPLYFGTFVSIWGLLQSLYKVEPLTRSDVFSVALYAAAIVLNVITIFIIRVLILMNKTIEALGEWRDLVKEQSSMIESISDTYKEFIQTLTNLSDKPPETTLGKVRSKIKKLIGD